MTTADYLSKKKTPSPAQKLFDRLLNGAYLKHMKLRDLRKKRRLTLAQAGSEIGVSGTAIGRYERGDRRPNWDVMQQIYRWSHHKITPNDFMPEIEEHRILQRHKRGWVPC